MYSARSINNINKLYCIVLLLSRVNFCQVGRLKTKRRTFLGPELYFIAISDPVQCNSALLPTSPSINPESHPAYEVTPRPQSHAPPTLLSHHLLEYGEALTKAGEWSLRVYQARSGMPSYLYGSLPPLWFPAAPSPPLPQREKVASLERGPGDCFEFLWSALG